MNTEVRGKSLVNIVPRGNNVLIRMEFKVRLLAIASGKPDENDGQSKVRYVVAGIGPKVEDLELGETVNMALNKEYNDVPVQGNMRSVRELTKFYKDMDRVELNKLIADKDQNEVQVIQYGMFPEFMIPAHDESIPIDIIG